MSLQPTVTDRFDPTGPHAVAADDVVYAQVDGIDLLARIYRPIGDDAPVEDRPIVIDVHGGAWHFFDRCIDAYYDERLAACGAVVVAVDFRQAPDHRWPTAAADVNAGVRWAKAHAAELGGRADDVGILGGSSGGHLALVTALRPDGDQFLTTPFVSAPIELECTDGFPELDDVVVTDADAVDSWCSYALALWPVAAPDWRYRYLLDRIASAVESREPMFDPALLQQAHDRFFGDEATMRASSALRMVEEREFDQLPPIWMAHPEHDENVTIEMSERFVAAYHDAGGDATLELFVGQGHSFANFGGEAADRCVAHMRAFIARQLTP